MNEWTPTPSETELSEPVIAETLSVTKMGFYAARTGNLPLLKVLAFDQQQAERAVTKLYIHQLTTYAKNTEKLREFELMIALLAELEKFKVLSVHSVEDLEQKVFVQAQE